MQEIKIVCKQSNVTISINDKEYLVNTFFSFGCFEDYINVDKDSSLKTYEEKIKKFIMLNIEDVDRNLTIENVNMIDDKIVNLFISSFLDSNNNIKACYDDLSSISDKNLRFWTSIKKEIDMESIKIGEMFSELQETIAPVRNRILELAETFGKQISKTILSTIQPFIESIRKGLGKLGESMVELARSIKIPELSEKEKLERINSYKQWGLYGWTSISNAPISFFNNCPDTQLKADKEALIYCNKESLACTFNALKNFKKKKKDINEAIKCFNSKYYKGCALILFSIIDSIFITKQIGNDEILTGAKAIKLFKKPFKKRINKKDIFILTLSYYNIFTCLFEIFSDTNNFKDKKNLINRNYLDHGMTNKVIRKKDCIKLFLLLDNILELLDLVENKLSKD